LKDLASDKGNVVFGSYGRVVWAVPASEIRPISRDEIGTIGPVPLPDTYHYNQAQSLQDGLILEAGNQAFGVIFSVGGKIFGYSGSSFLGDAATGILTKSESSFGATRGTVAADVAADLSVPGRVQSRINVSNEGMGHVLERHLDPSVNASQFTISESELRSLLQSQDVVSAPVLRTVQSGDGLAYIREINVGSNIGLDKFSGNLPTSTLTVMTDKYGNLITTFPGKLK
jgi:hypothetical protein